MSKNNSKPNAIAAQKGNNNQRPSGLAINQNHVPTSKYNIEANRLKGTEWESTDEKFRNMEEFSDAWHCVTRQILYISVYY